MKRILIFLLMLLPAFGFSQAPESLVHSSTSYVDDFANVFTPEQRTELDGMIRAFHDTVQFSLVTVNSLNDMDPAEFAIRLGNHWGVGSKSNNGVLILVCPSEHKFFTATGGGVQADLTDDRCTSYFEDYAKPHFKENDYFGGCKEILAQYISLLSPSAKEIRAAQEAAKAEALRKSAQKVKTFMLYFIPTCAIIALIVALFVRARRKEQERQKQWNRDKTDYDRAMGQINYAIDLAKANPKCLDSGKLLSVAETQGVNKMIRITKMKGPAEMQDQMRKLNSIISMMSPLRKSIENHVTAMNSAKILISSWSSSEVSKTRSELDRIKVKLDKREVDSSDQTKSIDKADTLIVSIQKEVQHLSGLIKTTTSQSDLQSQVDRVQRIQSDISTIFRNLEAVIETDARNTKIAKTAETVAAGEIEEYEKYVKKSGVSSASAVKTKATAESFRKRIGELSGLGLAGRLAWLAAFAALIKAASNPAKDESLAYEAEQRRLAQIEADRQRKKREQEEEEERRRRSSISSSFSSSYSSDSSYSSSSSSSFSISSSSFGGGSFDGGGGGGSW